MKRIKNIYDNDNNIKPIEVNFNNNEYIIFSRFCRLFVRRFMMTIIVHISGNNKIYFFLFLPSTAANAKREILFETKNRREKR
jgi:hypothetical protein